MKRNITNFIPPLVDGFLFDDSDIAKPYGRVFEELGVVRDGSASCSTFGKRYWGSQVVGLTHKTMQSFPVAHQIYLQYEKESSYGIQKMLEKTHKNLHEMLVLTRSKKDSQQLRLF